MRFTKATVYAAAQLLCIAGLFILLAPYADMPSEADEAGGFFWQTLKPLDSLAKVVVGLSVITMLLHRLVGLMCQPR